MKTPTRRATPGAALAALPLLLLLAAPGRAADPEATCRRATAKALSTCVAAVGAAETGCFRKTGAACAAADAKVAKALGRASRTVLRRCADASAVAAAGYAPLDPAGLASRFEEACAREVGEIAERVLGGPDGPRLDGATEDDAKCLVGAHGVAGDVLAKALAAVGRCAGRSCDLAKNEARLARLEQRAAAKLVARCDDLPGLAGVGAAELAAGALERTAAAASSPCDPLDPGHCLFPFPNDYFTVGDAASPTGRRLHVAIEATPRNSSGTPVDPSAWHAVDGFSVGPVLLFHDPALDLVQSAAPPLTDLAASLDPGASVLLLDAETGARQLLWLERDLSHEVEAEQAILGRVGANLENGRRYLVALRGLRDAGGALRPASEVFAAYRDRTPTGQLPVEARRARMERLFDELEGFGVARAELQLAWEFTTQSVESTASRLLAMRDEAMTLLAGAAPAFTVDTVTEPVDANTFRRIDGTFESPLFLTDAGVPGSELRLGADGLPESQGDPFTASYRCVVPFAATTGGAAPAVPARAALYGHGLLGSADETGASHVRALASEYNFVICGTDWTGFAEDDLATVYDVLADFSNFPRFIDRQHQGVLNFLVLGRLLKLPDGFASHAAFQVGGEPLIDAGAGLFYDGNSQGGILGGVLAAFAQDIERFVLGVPGINYSTLLNRSIDFQPFGIVLRATYPDGLDRSVLLALAQILWDRTDPSGHVRHTTSDAYPDTPPKKILYHVAFGDHQVAPLTVEVAARSNGAHIHTPALPPGKLVPEVTPYYGIPAIPAYPFDGSAMVVWDSGNPAPPVETLPPPEITPLDPEWATLTPCAQNWDSDPHECPRRAPEARLQKSEFLRAGGAVVDACGGAACLAPTF